LLLAGFVRDVVSSIELGKSSGPYTGFITMDYASVGGVKGPGRA